MVATQSLAALLALVWASEAGLPDEDVSLSRFTGTVLGVELFDACEKKPEWSETDAKIVVTVRVDAVPEGEKLPVALGGRVAFGLESTSMTFRAPLADILGRRCAFDVVLADGRFFISAEELLVEPRAEPPEKTAAPPELPEDPLQSVYANWTTEPDPEYARSVVNVRATFDDGHRGMLHGNGVLIEGGGAGSRRILTVAHLVERETARAKEVHVGLFAHSFRGTAPGFPRPVVYVECVAKLVHCSAGTDLALLEIPLIDELYAVPVGEDDLGDSLALSRGISIFPYGRPRAFRIQAGRSLDRGQSGSPAIVYGKLFGIVQMGDAFYDRMCSNFRRSVEPRSGWAGTRAIRDFLDSYVSATPAGNSRRNETSEPERKE